MSEKYEKWADWLISAARFNQTGTLIEKVRCHFDLVSEVGSSIELTREEIIEQMMAGLSFCTIVTTSGGQWEKGEEVHLFPVKGEDFLKTLADFYKKDNLDNLPTF